MWRRTGVVASLILLSIVGCQSKQDSGVKESAAKTTDVPSSPNLSDDLTKRLDRHVTIKFQNTPLCDAVAGIAGQAELEIALDGEGLQSGGFTTQMSQKLELSDVTAKAALDQILSKYAQERDPIVLAINSTKSGFVMTVKSRAVAQNLTIVMLPAEKQ